MLRRRCARTTASLFRSIPAASRNASISVDSARSIASWTRLAYNAETAGGTSGAPCFNQNYELVGVHNAAFAPHNIPIFNQAVPFRGSNEAAAAAAIPMSRPAARPRSGASAPIASSPRVIIGRKTAADWIDKGATELPASRSSVSMPRRRSTARSGKTFSLDILKARCGVSPTGCRIRHRAQRKLPTSAADFVTALLTQLGIPGGHRHDAVAAVTRSNRRRNPRTSSTSGYRDRCLHGSTASF